MNIRKATRKRRGERNEEEEERERGFSDGEKPVLLKGGVEQRGMDCY